MSQQDQIRPSRLEQFAEAERANILTSTRRAGSVNLLYFPEEEDVSDASIQEVSGTTVIDKQQTTPHEEQSLAERPDNPRESLGMIETP